MPSSGLKSSILIAGLSLTGQNSPIQLDAYGNLPVAVGNKTANPVPVVVVNASSGAPSTVTAFQGGTWNVNVANTPAVTVTGTVSVQDTADFNSSGTTSAPSQATLIGGKTNDATPQYQPIPLSAAGGAVIVQASGTFSVTQGTTPWVDNISQFGGSNVVTGVGASGAGIPRVTVSNDSAVKIWDGTTVVGVTAGNAEKTDQTSVAGTAIATAGSGIQKVGIVGAAAVQLDIPQNNAAAANSLSVGGTYNSTLPTLSTGNQSALQLDIKGQQLFDLNYYAGVALGAPSNYGTSPGAVTVFGTNSFVTNTVTVQGAAASGASKSGSPVQVGAVFNTTQPTVTNGQIVEGQATARGALIVATGTDTFTVTLNSSSKVIPWDGTTQATFKPASTVSIPGDTSLVAQISPNQPTSNMTGQSPGTAGNCTTIVGGQYNTSAPAPSNGQTLANQMDSSGNLKVNVATGTISGAAATEATAAWTSGTAGNTTVALTTSNYGTTVVSLHQGSTISGGVVTFEASDTIAGTNWYPIQGTAADGSATGTSYTLVASTNIAFAFSSAGWAQIRVRLSTAITGSATVNVGISAMAFGGGGSSGGVVTQPTAANLNATVLFASPQHVIVDSGGGGGTQYTTGSAQATPTGTVALGWDGTTVKALPLDVSGNLKVAVISGGGSSASVGTVNSAAPTSADQIGWNTGNNLQSVSSVFPLPVQIIQNENDSGYPLVMSGLDTNGDPRPLLTDQDGALIISDQTSTKVSASTSQLTITTPSMFLTGSQATTITSSTALTTILAAQPGYFACITGLTITNSSSTATLVTLSDGFKSYIYALGGPGGIVMQKVSPKIATNPNAVWTLTCGTSVASIYVDVEYVNIPLNQVIRNGSQGTTITSSTAATTIVPAVPGRYTNLTSLVITNSSASATLVTLSDGTKSYIYSVQGPGGLVMSKATPKAATNPNTVWTITCGTSLASLYIDAEWVLV